MNFHKMSALGHQDSDPETMLPAHPLSTVTAACKGNYHLDS